MVFPGSKILWSMLQSLSTFVARRIQWWSTRLFKRSDLHYPRLKKYDQIDGYINTSSKICIFGPCGALYNPAASQILIWICLWQGRCGKIIKCVDYDPVNKKIIDNWKGLIFYRLSWIFADEMASNLVATIIYCSYITVYVKHQVFDELEVGEAYEKYCSPHAYRGSEVVIFSFKP